MHPTADHHDAEKDARAVWHAGNAAFKRSWPYAYSLSAGEAQRRSRASRRLPAAGRQEAAPDRPTLGVWQAWR